MKLSEFILHLTDAIKDVNRDIYSPKSSRWHEPARDICFACLAGIYAAASKWVEPNQYIFPYAIDKPYVRVKNLTLKEKRTLKAIDCIRVGSWDRATTILNEVQGTNLKDPFTKANCPINPYMYEFQNWKEFDLHVESLERRAHQLKTLGF